MWPWGHAAVGYLLYTTLHRSRDGRPPSGTAVLAVVFGTQLPDLVDKPLAWTLAVLPAGRSLAHSWIVAGAVLALAWWLRPGSRESLLAPLGVGWLSHGVADGLYSILTWEPAYLGYLLWPVTTTPPSETEQSFLAHLLAFQWDWMMSIQLVLVVVAVLAWIRDGTPGLETLRAMRIVVSKSANE